MTVFIGDVHGKFNQYSRIIKQQQNTIQVGDLGVGFRRWPHGENYANPPYDLMVKTGARFICGNHDNPTVCHNHSQNIKNGTVENDMFFLGGAASIDQAYRNEGFDWWEGEQDSISKLNQHVDVYVVTKPRIVITHDCPTEIVIRIHGAMHYPESRTQQALQSMFEIHQPDFWVFGHHHTSFRETINGTRFICLNELEVLNLT